MPRNVPAEYTGRFSIKPKKSRSKLKPGPPPPAFQDAAAATSPLPESLRSESIPFRERKRKVSHDESTMVAGPSSRSAATPSMDDDNDALSLYSQQLQVQSPRYRLGQTPEHLVGGAARAPSFNIGDQPSPRSDADPSPEPEKVLRIFNSVWARSSAGNRVDSSAAAHTLAYHIATAAEPKEPIERLQNAVMAIVESSSTHPESLDSMLNIFDKASKILPTVGPKHADLTKEAAAHQLEWWLATSSKGFEVDNTVLAAGAMGTSDTNDRSNIKFRSSDVSDDLEGVIARMQGQKRGRRRCMVAAAMHARCFALDMIRMDDDGGGGGGKQQIVSLIEAGLSRRQERWSKADMIGACVLLRGCAKSLLDHLLVERECNDDRFQKWKARLESFLLQDGDTWDNDFVVKAHASALRNLIDGPMDESSEQLFSSESWVY